MKKLWILLAGLWFIGCMATPVMGFRMSDKDHITALASQDKFLTEDYSDASKTKYTTMADIDTYLSGIYCDDATILVAASDSLNKDKADYICDGINDEIQINQALAALPSGGGSIRLLEGTFIVNAQTLMAGNNYTEDDGTLADSSIAADASLYVDLDDTPTDIGYMTFTVTIEED